ncbi:MAG: hypothetical protein QOF41_2575 [Methylobacteriaceae bacterium]|nr:hypothetical protein [Methylobacteriaceae bacterium]
MRVSLIAAIAAPVIAGFIGASNLAQAADPPIPQECTAALDKAEVMAAYKFVSQPEATSKPMPPPGTPTPVTKVALGDVIELKVSERAKGASKDVPKETPKDVSKDASKNVLKDVLEKCTNQTIVLYLNGYSMTSLKPEPLTAPDENTLRFTLKFLNDVRTTWVPILGYPSFAPRDVLVSFGVQGQYPVRSGATLTLETIGNVWFFIWLALFIVLLYGFLSCVRNTNIIRDGDPAAEAAGTRRTYSLSKTQGAVWLFVILAAYLLIGLVTGDFVNSINSTALILLGIGAGTVLSSAIIDASKQAQSGAATAQAIADNQAKLTGIDQHVASIEQALSNPALTPEQRAYLDKDKIDTRAKREETLSARRKLTGENEQFLIDILSDANGVSFHRFQMAAWTLVLALVFIKGVYENLAMPTFDTTLMGLLGLSAATYLGLKIPEATTPKNT